MCSITYFGNIFFIFNLTFLWFIFVIFYEFLFFVEIHGLCDNLFYYLLKDMIIFKTMWMRSLKQYHGVKLHAVTIKRFLILLNYFLIRHLCLDTFYPVTPTFKGIFVQGPIFIPSWFFDIMYIFLSSVKYVKTQYGTKMEPRVPHEEPRL